MKKTIDPDIVELMWLRRERKIKAKKATEGIPPLTFKSNAKDLNNYRIYGNTVNGESVGDRTRNLFDGKIVKGSFNPTNGKPTMAAGRIRSNSSDFIYLTTGTYTINADGVDDIVCYAYSSEDVTTFLSNQSMVEWCPLPYTFTVQTSCYFLFAFRFSDNSDITPFDISNIMLNTGSEPLPYEPYGYRVPVTVEGQNLFDKNDFIPLNNMYVKQTNATLTIGAGNLGFVLPLNKGNYTVSCLLDRVNLSLFAGIFSTFPNEGDVALSVFKILYNDAKLSFSLANNGFLFMAYNNTAVTQYHTTEEILNALMIVRGSNAPTKYEPYHAPATTNLYLPEQIKMVGDEAEYVNYKEQKQHFADGTSIDVALPALPTFKGTNMLSVGTEVQPSKVLIKT